ncbi:uncharacterized protein G2W53_004646 [Senna tora]|uniref:Uncharacterized protein n=1 Tax=Senna tora TaxID=362788 RepID=A0A834XBI7_9FABA|nr:uncharacterized protein G2W53_004646 [Senna tora]
MATYEKMDSKLIQGPQEPHFDRAELGPA